MKNKAFIVAPWAILLVIMLSSCFGDTPTQADPPINCDASANSHSTLRSYDYSPECDALAQIYDARMKTVNTWTVIYSMGKPVFVCPSKGYPIPYTTEFTNPMQETYHGAAGNAVIPQAEPNGLFTGTSNATWVLCIRALAGGGSETVPVYSEPDALAFPYPVQIGNDGSVQDAGGSSSVQIIVKSGATPKSKG
jgi:hypothetical protein